MSDALLCGQYLCFCLLFIVVYCIPVIILLFVWLNSAFWRCFVWSIVQLYHLHIEGLFLVFCCLFSLLLCFFLCFTSYYWVLIRWMAVCQAYVYISWCYCSFRVPLLSDVFYMAPLFIPSISLLFIVIYVFFNVLDVAVVRESRVLLFSMMLS